MTAEAVSIRVECRTCAGSGEVGTRQDYFGTWETAPCPWCRGLGDLDALDAEKINAATCIHGEVEMDDHECVLCMYARHPEPGPNPWRDGAIAVVGGWDADPPF